MVIGVSHYILIYYYYSAKYETPRYNTKILYSSHISIWLQYHFFNMFHFQHSSIGHHSVFCLAGVIVQPNQDLELLQSRCWTRFRHEIRRHPAAFQVYLLQSA
ncbi:unnamed protein product [Albugo candida]|uniref:Uncharacterized protein n=1 Tax=Albugo candida TaxID=65357 RepID=A0A024GU81_9STRA|nr:unnamed protein product [Albugo candida]|eukprot:CCI50296.1 unnamed protein product [Albugo candida]